MTTKQSTWIVSLLVSFKREDDNQFMLPESFNRRATRFKPSPQPVTMEFLRERFSDSQISHMPDNSTPSIREHYIFMLSPRLPTLFPFKLKIIRVMIPPRSGEI